MYSCIYKKLHLGCTLSDANSNLHQIYALAQQDSTYSTCAKYVNGITLPFFM